jgi:hypothetical protein
MTDNHTPAFLIDGISSIAVNNGVARIMFMRLDINGKPMPELELHIPMNQIVATAQSLAKIK